MSLKPSTWRCPCGAPAVAGAQIEVTVGGTKIQAFLSPICAQHGAIHLGRVRAVTLTTHHPVGVEIVSTFPPRQGQVTKCPDGGIMVACPQCGALVDLDAKVFTLEEEGLKPSFICPFCKLHAWLLVSGGKDAE